MLITVCLLQLFSCAAPNALSTYEDCEIHGSAKMGRKEYRLNEYKNRYSFPGDNDYLHDVNLEQLLSGNDEGQFSVDKAVSITGYVYKVKMGGVETCNCKEEDERHRDTHIEVTPDAEHTSAEYRLIVEVTPRMRTMMGVKGTDWSTEELRQQLTGHKVKFQGWLFYDEEHESQSFATRPNGKRNWRASCWELHPVTRIEVVD